MFIQKYNEIYSQQLSSSSSLSEERKKRALLFLVFGKSTYVGKHYKVELADANDVHKYISMERDFYMEKMVLILL